jgi:transcriptional regulator with GAF, ATPase, and Fis domain
MMDLVGTSAAKMHAPDRGAMDKNNDIEKHPSFELLVESISSRLADVGWETDAALDSILAELGTFLAADRITYIRLDTKRGSLTPSRHWFAEGIERDRSILGIDVARRLPWLSQIVEEGEPVAINSVADLPDSAQNERAYCDHVGIQSFTMVPARLGGTVTAALAVDSIRERRQWDKTLIERLRLIAEIVASTGHRVELQKGLIELRNFERVAFELSTRFVNLPADQIDAEIEVALGEVANALDVQLVTVIQPVGQGDFEVSYEWSEDKRNRFKGLSVADGFPWLDEQLKKGEPLPIGKLDDFPADASIESGAMKEAGFEAVLWAPFEARGELAGYIAVDTNKEREWSDDLVSRLRLLGEVFGEALKRREAETELRASYRKIQTLKEQVDNENVYLRRESGLEYDHGEIVGDSEKLQSALMKVEQVAPTETTVLITGETGTGKELMARAIHMLSARRDKLMVTVNCAALPASLVEAELFGREKGAYTGALTREAGRFELANGSTILLDEIGELPLELQAKLLRVLETGEFQRLGSSKTQKVDVRVLASTNRDLAAEVKNKRFREDLYYRLDVFPIEIPPLRERVDDIPKLVWAFVQDFCKSMGKNIESIPAQAMDSLLAYAWPGNVREVKNIVERAMIVSQGPVLEVELGGGAGSSQGPSASSRRLLDVEREHIRAVVEGAGWRIRGTGGAAEILGLKPTTLEARMKKLGLERPNTP